VSLTREHIRRAYIDACYQEIEALNQATCMSSRMVIA